MFSWTRSHRVPNLGCRGAESPGWFDVFPKTLREMWCKIFVFCDFNTDVPLLITTLVIWFFSLFIFAILAKTLSILLIFSKNHLLVFLYLSIVFLFSVLFISTLIIIISFLLLDLSLICSYFSRILRCKIRLLIWYFSSFLTCIFTNTHECSCTPYFHYLPQILMLYFHFHLINIFSNFHWNSLLNPLFIW